jgi:hypothetical protein
MEPTPVRPGGTERVEGPGPRRRDGGASGQRRGPARRRPAAEEPEPAMEEPDIGPDPVEPGHLDIVV